MKREPKSSVRSHHERAFRAMDRMRCIAVISLAERRRRHWKVADQDRAIADCARDVRREMLAIIRLLEKP